MDDRAYPARGEAEMEEPMTGVATKACWQEWKQSFTAELRVGDEADPHLQLKRERGWVDGVRRLDLFSTICLEVVEHRLHITQFEVFRGIIPLMIPTLFGINFYNQYVDDLNGALGMEHDKTMYMYVGSRRDGKSVIISIIAAAIMVAAVGDVVTADAGDMESRLSNVKVGGRSGECVVLSIPALGPSLATGKRLVGLVKSVFQQKGMAKYVTKVVSNSQICYGIRVGKTVREIRAYAVTEVSLRGLSAKIEFVDEFFAFTQAEYSEKVTPLLLSRYTEQSVRAVVITTPNAANAWTRQFLEDSSVVKVKYNARICQKCLDSCVDYADIKKTMEECEKAGHVPPLNIPWKSAERDAAWAVYMSRVNHLQELCGVSGVSSELQQFHAAITRYGLFKSRTSGSAYVRIDVGIDIAQGGDSSSTSELALIAVGHTGERWEYIGGASNIPSDAGLVVGWLRGKIMDLLHDVVKLGVFNQNKNRMFIWVESNLGKYGRPLAEALREYGLSYVCKVMKGDRLDPITGRFQKYGVNKDEFRSGNYPVTTRDLIQANMFKISDIMWGGDKILQDLEEQMHRYTNDGGKMTGKDGGNDDLVIALMTGLANGHWSLNVEHPLYRETKEA